MGLIDEIKALVGKFIQSPFKTGIAAYLIWKILKPQSETVALFEGIKVLHSDEGKELVQDTATDYYGVIKGTSVSYFKDLDEAEKFYHEGVRMKKLESLHKAVVLKESKQHWEQILDSMEAVDDDMADAVSALDAAMRKLDGLSLTEASKEAQKAQLVTLDARSHIRIKMKKISAEEEMKQMDR